MKNILIYPGFRIDTWCCIEERETWLEKPLSEHFNVYWLIPPIGSKYSRLNNEQNREKEPIYVTHLKKLGAKLIIADLTNFNFIKNFLLLRGIFKTYEIDAVVSHFSRLRFHVELCAKISGVKVIKREHNCEFDKNRRFQLIKRIFWKFVSDYYLPISKAVEDHLEENGLLGKNSYMIYGGHDFKSYPASDKEKNREDLIREFRLSSNNRIISCIAKIHRSKQQHILIEMLHELKGKELVLFLVGDETDKTYSKEVYDLVKKYDLEKHVIFTGYRFDKFEIMDASEITYLPSLFEGLACVMIESFYMRTPIIASDIPPIKEVITNGVNGYCVRQDRVSEYCARTIELLEDKEKRIQFAENGRKDIIDKFSKGKFINENIKGLQKAFDYFDNKKMRVED